MGVCNCSAICKDTNYASIDRSLDESSYINDSKDQITISYICNPLDFQMSLNSTVKNLISEHSGKIHSAESTKLISLPDKSFFLGESAKNSISGSGERFYANGSYAKGHWTDDFLDGKALFIQNDGSYFLGEFKNWNMHGFGKMYNAQARYTYQGHWADNFQDGSGTEEWESGALCVGNFKNGLKNGKCVMIKHESYYAGDFMDDKISGFGTFHWSDGKSYEGWWENSQMHGLGTFVWPDGKKYVGFYAHDKKSGYGVFYWAEGQRYEGQWLDGVQHGIGKIVDEIGQEMFGEWVNGHRLRWITNFDNI